MLTINPVLEAGWINEYPIMDTFEMNIYESLDYEFDNPFMNYYEYWITHHNLELEDKRYNLGFSKEEEYFSLKYVSSSKYTHSNPDIAWRILIQLDNTEIITQRIVYGIFEVLGDVGGFSEAILWLASFLAATYT